MLIKWLRCAGCLLICWPYVGGIAVAQTGACDLVGVRRAKLGLSLYFAADREMRFDLVSKDHVQPGYAKDGIYTINGSQNDHVDLVEGQEIQLIDLNGELCVLTPVFASEFVGIKMTRAFKLQGISDRFNTESFMSVQ